MEILLRSLHHDDATVLSSWATDVVFCAHADWRRHEDPDATVQWWRAFIAEPDPRLLRLLAVDEGGSVVGYVDLHGDHDGERELGFVIAPSLRWGLGLGASAARAGLTYAFTVLGLSRVWAEALEANAASVRILQGLGMREIAPGVRAVFLGAMSRYRRFEILRAEFS